MKYECQSWIFNVDLTMKLNLYFSVSENVKLWILKQRQILNLFKNCSLFHISVKIIHTDV
jgi:hypothetical protein